VKSGLLRIETAALRDMKVHVAGDAAIVSLAGAATGSYKGKPFADGSKGFDVFAKRDGRWQVVYSQMTSIRE
jgi:ketosteroid isomerase-like protein